MPPRPHNHYSALYSQPLPTERRFNIWPFALGAALVVVVGGLMWWAFFGAGSDILFPSSQAPSLSDRTITLDLAGQRFFIPENYLRSRDQRSGGEVERIDIFALWPSMKGFNEDDAEQFRDKSADSRVIYVTLTAPTQVWRPAERFYQVYPYYFAGPEEPAEHGLMTRKMDDGSGIADHDVLYHQGADHLALFHCLRDQAELIPADCIGDQVIEPRILARYRFRRALLEDWREIDAAVEQLLAGFAGH
jgi:hypothetical protein